MLRSAIVAAYLSVWLPSIVHGQVTTSPTGSITGRVVNGATGDGLAQVHVIALFADQIDANAAPGVAVTQTDGSFRIGKLQPEVYRLLITKDGFSIQNPLSSLLVSVSPGETPVPVQFAMASNGGVVGNVVDEDGIPQPDITVYALTRSGEWRVAEDQSAHGHALTDHAGHYSLRGLADGNYYLLAVAEKAAESTDHKPPPVPSYYPEAASSREAVPVTVRAGQAISADIKLHRSGRHTVQGSIVDLPLGLSLKDLSLVMTPLDYELPELRRTVAITREGRFMIGDVPSGRFEFLLTRMSEHKHNVTLGSQEIEVGTQDVRDVSISCILPATVHARAVFESGSPVSTASMYLMLHGKWLLAFERFASDGTLVLGDVSVGQYWLTLPGIPKGYYASSILVNKQDTKNGPVDLSGGGLVDIEVRLRTGSGTLVATVDGYPSVAVLVPSEILPDHSNVQLRPVHKGLPVVFDNLPPGDYTLYAGTAFGWDLWKVPDFLSAVKNWGTTVHLEENGSAQVELSPIGDDVMKETAQRSGLSYTP